MNIEDQPLKTFFLEAIIKTPQGWFVIVSFVANSILVTLVLVTNWAAVVPESGPMLIYILVVPWPFVVLSVFVASSSPHYRSSLMSTLITAGFCFAPYWWLYV